jgi:hypothetical protein
MERYTYYIAENQKQVIAVSSYAGRIVRAVAKCDPRDEFSIETGKKLAAARCNLKVAAKRAKRANSKLEEAWINVRKANAHKCDMIDYVTDAEAALAQAKAELADIEQSMGE